MRGVQYKATRAKSAWLRREPDIVSPAIRLLKRTEQIKRVKMQKQRATSATAIWTATLCLAMAGTACVSTSGPSGSPQDSASTAPRDANALLVGAELALQRKQYLEAAQALSAAAAASDDETLAERATSVAYEHFQNTYALKSADRWLQLNISSEEAHRYAGFAALRLYRIDIATEHFDALIGTAFISPAAGFMALAPQWFDVGSRPAVLALLQQLVQRHGNVAEAHLVLSQAALQAENLSVALAAAQKAVEISPYWQPAKSLLARVQLASGQAEVALASARALAEQENRPEQRLEYAQMLYAGGKEDEGRRELEALTQVPEASFGAQRTLALIELERGQMDAARKRWRELVQAGRFVYEGLYYLGQIAERRGETADAIELYSRVTGSDLAVNAQSRAALIKSRATNVNDGVSHLRAFAEEHDEFVIDIVIAQASLLAELGRTKQAVELLDAAMADYPDRDDLLVSKALLLERDKRTPDALKAMRELARLRPDDPTVLNMLGYTLVDRTRDVAEGLEMIRRALNAMPDNGPILDSMGWALHRQKRDAEALDYLQRAHERAGDPEIALHLGDVLWALGRADAARETYARALERAPDNAELKDRLEKRKARAPK